MDYNVKKMDHGDKKYTIFHEMGGISTFSDLGLHALFQKWNYFLP